MSHNVYANTWQIAAKAGMNKSIARFPDVCLSPPGPPAGPIPIPYPDTSFSTDLKQGSTTVMIAGKPVALAQQSHYQPSVLGNEAATNSFGASVVTHKITGKTVFQSWSMDVKFEGKNVCRHIDLTTSNHNCPPPATPPAPSGEAQTLPATLAALKDKKCPCCGEALHDWQKKDPTDPNSEALDPIPEDEFYAALAKPFAAKGDALRAASAEVRTMLEGEMLGSGHQDLKFFASGQPPSKANVILVKEKFYADTVKELKTLRDANPDCPNVAKTKDAGCGAHFAVPPGKHDFKVQEGKNTVVRKMTYAQRCDKAFSEGQRNKSFDAWEKANPGMPKAPRNSTKVNHKTPKQAGGCNSPGNTVPDPYLTKGPCAKIEELQSALHSTQN